MSDTRTNTPDLRRLILKAFLAGRGDHTSRLDYVDAVRYANKVAPRTEQVARVISWVTRATTYAVAFIDEQFVMSVGGHTAEFKNLTDLLASWSLPDDMILRKVMSLPAQPYLLRHADDAPTEEDG